MPRLRQVSRDEATSEVVRTTYQLLFGDRDPVREPGTNTGTPGDWWTVFALVPDVLKHSIDGFLLYHSPDRVLDPRLRELGQARVGWACGSQFVYSQHCKSMRELGMSEAQIEGVAHWPAADCFDERERLVLAYTDCLAYDRGRVPDGLFDALRRHLSDEAILELTYVTAMYLMHAVMSRALRTEFDDRPEPVVEVPGPDGAAPWDVVRDGSDDPGLV
jgi:alkylhydroperoxidase family enzyme